MIERLIRVFFIERKDYLMKYDIDVNKILISKKEPYIKKSSFKYIIGYDHYD